MVELFNDNENVDFFSAKPLVIVSLFSTFDFTKLSLYVCVDSVL